jgi:hypothetical protein
MKTLESYEDVEVDKIAGAWVLTYWLPGDITLRLKVRHTCLDDPNECIAEMRTQPHDEFQAIHQFLMAPYEFSHLDKHPDVWADLPTAWTREFATLAVTWARLTEIAEFGSTFSTRYAGEPHSSLDHFELGYTAEDANRMS